MKAWHLVRIKPMPISRRQFMINVWSVVLNHRSWDILVIYDNKYVNRYKESVNFLYTNAASAMIVIFLLIFVLSLFDNFLTLS